MKDACMHNMWLDLTTTYVVCGTSQLCMQQKKTHKAHDKHTYMTNTTEYTCQTLHGIEVGHVALAASANGDVTATRFAAYF
jgi:hypothetical protein